LKAGFDYKRPGFQHLEPETTVPLSEVELLLALENAASGTDADMEPAITEELDLPPVEVPTDLLERATNYATRCGTPLWAAISDYKFPPNEDLKARKAELFSELLSLYDRAGQFFTDARKLKLIALSTEHERARLECRAALARINALVCELAPLDSTLRRKREKTQQARVLFNSLSEGKPQPEHYPSQREIRQWQKQLGESKAALDLAVSEEAEVNDERNGIVSLIRRQRLEFDGHGDQVGVKQREEDLRLQLAGKPRTDFETGLKIPADF
jgi:hypothetical protein